MIAQRPDGGARVSAPLTPRPYRDERDLAAMRALLVAGRRADNGSYYVHVGDLDWWLFYLLDGEDWPRDVHLWKEGDRLIAWSLYSRGAQTFDAFVHPEVRGSRQARAIYAWASEYAAQRAAELGGEQLSTMWVLEDDEALTGFLGSAGFRRAARYMEYRARSLQGSHLPEPELPAGFQLRSVAGEHEVELRAAASYAAFEASMPFERYVQRYRRFMHTPVYDRERDLMVLAPDGRCAGFCLFWLDPANRVGLFEPVGVHPDFHRRGLGTAVVIAGLQRMQAAGMAQATVLSESENPAAQRLYQALGFGVVKRLRAYRKYLAAPLPDRPLSDAIWAEVT